MNLSTKHDDTLLSLSIQLVTIFEPRSSIQKYCSFLREKLKACI
jgi:hypothetical protein